MTIPSVDSTTLNNLSPNLDIGDVADPALRLASFQYIYTQMQAIVSELNSIPAGNLQNLSVTTGKIAELAVATSKIAELAVTTAKLNDLAVTLAKMAANSVGTTQLIDQCVTTAKIALASVGVAQLSPGAQVNESVNNALIVALKAETVTGVVNVKTGFGAKGDGVTDDTAAIVAALAFAASFTNVSAEVYFPWGTYCISSHIYLPATFGKVNSINKIIGNGAVIKSINSSVDFIFIGQESLGNQQNIYIEGIVFDGNYLSGGINLNKVSVWDVSKCKFINCTVGLQISDSYYGQISNETTFIGNLVSIKFTTGTTVENNTIKLGNVRISGLSDTTTFGTAGLSVVGIMLNSAVNTIKFDGVTLENVDYGILGYDMSAWGNTNGGLNGVITIKECYFEANRIKAISFGVVTITAGVVATAKNNSAAGKFNIMPTVNLLGNRFVSNGNQVQISSGIYFMRGNDGCAVNILASSSYALSLDTDLPKENVSWDTVTQLNTLMFRNPKITIDQEYSAYGESLGNRLQSNGLLATQENRDYSLLQDPLIFNKLSRFKNVRSATVGNVSFLSQEKRASGPIVKTNSGSYAMLQVTDAFGVVAKQVFNAGLIVNLDNVYLPHQAYKIQAAQAVGATLDIMGTNITFGTMETFTISSAKELTTTASGFTGQMVRIGTAKRILLQTIPAGNNNITFYDPAIDKYYNSFNGTLTYLGDYLGISATVKALNILAAGLLASRPATPSVESTYYATDNNTYYIYTGGSWSTLTPLFAV